MALISSNNIKFASWSRELVLTAAANESFLVKDIYIGSVSGGYASIFIETCIQGFFRVDSTTLGNHLPFTQTDSKLKTILGVLAEKGIFKGYPVPAGSRFIVRCPSDTTIAVKYDRYDPGDIKPEMPNGLKSKSLLYISYGQPASSISSAGEHALTVKVNPSEFSDFPFRSEVSAFRKYILYGIVFSARAKTGAATSDFIATSYLRIAKGRDTLFDPDRVGLPVWGTPPGTANTLGVEHGLSVSGENSHNNQADIFFLDQPVVFEQGDELDAYWVIRTGGAGATFTMRELEIAYVLEEIKL